MSLWYSSRELVPKGQIRGRRTTALFDEINLNLIAFQFYANSNNNFCYYCYYCCCSFFCLPEVGLKGDGNWMRDDECWEMSSVDGVSVPSGVLLSFKLMWSINIISRIISAIILGDNCVINTFTEGELNRHENAGAEDYGCQVLIVAVEVPGKSTDFIKIAPLTDFEVNILCKVSAS